MNSNNINFEKPHWIINTSFCVDYPTWTWHVGWYKTESIYLIIDFIGIVTLCDINRLHEMFQGRTIKFDQYDINIR